MKTFLLALVLLLGVQAQASQTQFASNTDWDAEASQFFQADANQDVAGPDALLATASAPSCRERCSNSYSKCRCNCFSKSGDAARRCSDSCERSNNSCTKCCKN